MKTSRFTDAVRETRPRGGFPPAVEEHIRAIVLHMAAGMGEYGDGLLSRTETALAGGDTATARKPEKSPAQRARTSGKPRGKAGRTERAAVAEERASKGRKHCPECGRGAGFGASHCQYDGTALVTA